VTDPKRVLLAMSGGVDSSVAGGLLRAQGHEVVGVTLHLWDAEGEAKVGRCCAPEDRRDARQSADALGIPHYVLDERQAFARDVVEPFVREYQAGRTPSPCVHCNRTVKLSYLFQVADRFGCSHVATGHYARVVRGPDGHALLRGRDRQKDQSYFLFGLDPKALSRLVFPLGEMVKDESRHAAREMGLPNADKPDSQELCFVPDGDIAGFIERRSGRAEAGEIVDEDGTVLGQHAGVAGFTVGQRRGLGLGGGPVRYVLRVLANENRVVVGPEGGLSGNELLARDARWLNAPREDEFEAEVRIRYRHAPARARVRRTADGFSARFVEPQRAITPGQAAVVYRGEEVLGGGFIV